MLALKKMASKKLAIYAAIIVLMLAGTGYLLYLNNRLAARKPLVVDGADQFKDYLPAETLATSTKIEAKKTGPSAQAKELRGGGGLDLTIFSDEKFKALMDNALIPKTAPSLGKRDPFKPN
ncbi:MAG: hypothetical protein AUK20_03420 [Parcubacteria group bacterium CG2_30_45_37]|nr:MAG: hypothetical protein AUK20_03420 [Parcubacteria group bacterium CG2_30_45_37]